MPAAYLDHNNRGEITESWADFHFRIETEKRLQLYEALILPLKDFCVAVREGVSVPASVSIHPATRSYADGYMPGIKQIYVNNKPEAVRMCSEGGSDACIGNTDVVHYYPNLRIIKEFQATMCWTLSRPSNRETAMDMK